MVMLSYRIVPESSTMKLIRDSIRIYRSSPRASSIFLQLLLIMTETFPEPITEAIASETLRITVPCSTSNFGPGFDCLGAALDQFLTINVLDGSNDVSIIHQGGYQPDVPDRENLIVTALQRVLDAHDTPVPPLDLHVNSDIPPGGGLGSSAAAVAAGGALGQLLLSGDIARDELFKLGYDIDGHPDNIAPTVYGGVTLSYLSRSESPESIRIATDLPDLYLIRPDVRIETEEARDLLPVQLPHEDAVFNLTRTGLLVHALSSGRYELLEEAMQDRLHQPFRATLLPGGTNVLQAGYDAGALGVWISGAGPTLGCFVLDGDRSPALAMADVLDSHGTSAEIRSADLVVTGIQTTCETTSDETDEQA